MCWLSNLRERRLNWEYLITRVQVLKRSIMKSKRDVEEKNALAFIEIPKRREVNTSINLT
jgi:hypothetical protein